MSQETVLYQSRTHPKILFQAGVMQLLIIALASASFLIPDDTSVKAFNDYAGWIILASILSLEIYFVILPALRWWNEIFTLTTHRVKNDWGILYKNSREIDLNRIVSISEERGILDRIFGCGTLNFYDPAATPEQNGASNNPLKRHGHGSGLKFHDVPNVHAVREMIEDARHNNY